MNRGATRGMLEKYADCRLENIPDDIDNPGQRLSTDIDNFTSEIFTLLSTLIPILIRFPLIFILPHHYDQWRLFLPCCGLCLFHLVQFFLIARPLNRRTFKMIIALQTYIHEMISEQRTLEGMAQKIKKYFESLFKIAILSGISSMLNILVASIASVSVLLTMGGQVADGDISVTDIIQA